MKNTLLFTLLAIPFLCIGQSPVILGSNVYGKQTQETFGASVSSSFDGLTYVAGAAALSNNANTFARVYTILPSESTFSQLGQDISGQFVGDKFGTSVSISNNANIIAVGAISNNTSGVDSGQVRAYENQSGTWTQIGQNINGDNIEDFFGSSVSLSGDGTILAIGAVQNSSSAGKVKIYQYQTATNSWVQIGQNIEGEATGDRFGVSISLSDDGSIIAIGANLNDGVNGADSGSVRVYENLAGTWTQIGQDIDGEAVDDTSGTSVSLSADGGIVAIGAPGNDDNENNSGHARIYNNDSGTWVQIGQDINGIGEGGSFGAGVSLSHSGTILACSSPGISFIQLLNVGAGTNGSGLINNYQNINGVWSEISVGGFIGFGGINLLGYSISISGNGNVIAAGAPGSNSSVSANDFLKGAVTNFDSSIGTLSTNSIELLEFNIFPNPVNNQFTIQLNPSVRLEKVTIYNNLGQLVLSSNKTIINTSKLASGLYIVEVQTNKGKGSKKLIIE